MDILCMVEKVCNDLEEDAINMIINDHIEPDDVDENFTDIMNTMTKLRSIYSLYYIDDHFHSIVQRFRKHNINYYVIYDFLMWIIGSRGDVETILDDYNWDNCNVDEI